MAQGAKLNIAEEIIPSKRITQRFDSLRMGSNHCLILIVWRIAGTVSGCIVIPVTAGCFIKPVGNINVVRFAGIVTDKAENNLPALAVQTMVCELTGMDVANASHYDGATAAAESIPMCRDRKHKTAYVSATTDPKVLEVMGTYCFGSNTKLVTVGEADGLTDMEDLKKLLEEDPEAACFYVESPNYYGNLEDVEAMAEIVHAQGAKLVLGIDPIAQAVIKTPRELGADIAVGDGQPLGMPIAFGGPYVGIMATTTDMMRKLPGRIVGETKDHDGNRAFVLTLQAREQHIRREKASSNICSNQDLCALTASVYMAAMGPDGMKEVAEQTMAKAHFLRDVLVKAGLTQKNCQGEFFNEFVTDCPMGAEALMAALDEKGILGGLPLDGDTLLWCATEVNSRSAMEEVADTVQSLMKGKEA